MTQENQPQTEEQREAEPVEGPQFETRRLSQYAATIVVDILLLIYGLGIGWSTIALPALTDPGEAAKGTDASDRDNGLTITLEQGSWLTAILYISAIPPMPLYSWICERFGRKPCGYLIGVPYVASAVLQSFASSFVGIQVSRAILGFASSGVFIFVPLYISEIAEDSVRGRLGAFISLMTNVGILVTYVLGTFLTYKQFEYVCIVPPVLFLVCFYWMPETPMHLLRHKEEAEAAVALRWLRGRRADVTRELVKMKDSLVAMNSAEASSGTLKDLLATRASRKALWIGLLLCCNQQLCGFFGVVSYTFLIFGEVAPDLNDVSNVIVGATLVLGIVVSMMIYDKINRRVLLLLSNFVMIFSLLILSVYFYYKHKEHDVSEYRWLPVTAMSIYVLGYSTGVAPLPVIILTEIFSPKVRNLGLTITGMFTWGSIFLVTKTFPMMTEDIGFHGACWVYTSGCLLGVVIAFTILPETRNRSLESILNELQNGKTDKRRVQETFEESSEKHLTSGEKKDEDECVL